MVRPINQATEKNLLYREWVEWNRAYVEKISSGRLGYAHMNDMSEGALRRFYIDLDADNRIKDGVVIDVRNNNGGFVNVYAIDVLARRGYMKMTPRGLPTAPARSVLGQRSLERPTILVTNQHSLSDAEDFTEGYRTLKLGKVVGEPTSGWIIYTGSQTLVDGTTMRMPRHAHHDARRQDDGAEPAAGGHPGDAADRREPAGAGQPVGSGGEGAARRRRSLGAGRHSGLAGASCQRSFGTILRPSGSAS